MLLPGLVPSVQQPTYPQVTANVTFPQGIQLMVTLAPGIALTVGISSETLEQWFAIWTQEKLVKSQELQVIRQISESKNL